MVKTVLNFIILLFLLPLSLSSASGGEREEVEKREYGEYVPLNASVEKDRFLAAVADSMYSDWLKGNLKYSRDYMACEESAGRISFRISYALDTLPDKNSVKALTFLIEDADPDTLAFWVGDGPMSCFECDRVDFIIRVRDLFNRSFSSELRRLRGKGLLGLYKFDGRGHIHWVKLFIREEQLGFWKNVPDKDWLGFLFRLKGLRVKTTLTGEFKEHQLLAGSFGL